MLKVSKMLKTAIQFKNLAPHDEGDFDLEVAQDEEEALYSAQEAENPDYEWEYRKQEEQDDFQEWKSQGPRLNIPQAWKKSNKVAVFSTGENSNPELDKSSHSPETLEKVKHVRLLIEKAQGVVTSLTGNKTLDKNILWKVQTHLQKARLEIGYEGSRTLRDDDISEIFKDILR